MPIGVLTVSSCVIIGGLIGTFLGRFIPERVRYAINFTFGIISIVIGVRLVVQMDSLPAVVLALLLGIIIGELVRLEDRVKQGTSKIRTLVERGTHQDSPEADAKMERLLSAMVLICTGIGGLVGAMVEGFSGDSSLLFSKALMDLLCAAIFAASLGIMVVLAAIPQFIILMALFLLSGVILPLTTDQMLGDFNACGGAISMVAGLRVAEIKQYKVINMLPALVLILPISKLWSFIEPFLSS